MQSSESLLDSTLSTPKPPQDSTQDFHNWRWQMSNRLTSLERLSEWLEDFEPTEAQQEVTKRYPFALTPYYASLIQQPLEDDPIFKMSVPQAIEGEDAGVLFRDPLGEEAHSPVPGLLHRYPDRAVLLVNGLCPVYCRHCTRKRFVGVEVGTVRRQQLEQWVRYLRSHPEIKDVILSGGDPLTLSDRRLEEILSAVRSVESVEIIRIGSRIPVLMPMRLTPELCDILEAHQPLWLVTHFNHPNEVSDLAMEYCQGLQRRGIPINNQSVLLRGINDHPDIIEDLCRKLVRHHIRPYYLHQCDLVQGIEHLRTPLSRGLQIMEALRGRLGGLAIPQYVVELPEGGGKVPLSPNYVLSSSPEYTVIRNFEDRIVPYPEPKIREHRQPSGRLRGGISDQLSGQNTAPLLPQQYHKPKRWDEQ